MRIIAGQLKSRQFNSPSGHKTHPMSDKMRGGLFNALGDITGLSVLDAYGGSGALSFEAISRGASRAIVIDSAQEAIKTIRQNIEILELSRKVKLISAPNTSWANTSNQTFDIVILDPPYGDINIGHLEKLSAKVNRRGIVVISLPKDFENRLKFDYDLVKEKEYGDGKLLYFKPRA